MKIVKIPKKHNELFDECCYAVTTKHPNCDEFDILVAERINVDELAGLELRYATRWPQ